MCVCVYTVDVIRSKGIWFLSVSLSKVQSPGSEDACSPLITLRPTFPQRIHIQQRTSPTGRNIFRNTKEYDHCHALSLTGHARVDI